jgi:hypothetical protein
MTGENSTPEKQPNEAPRDPQDMPEGESLYDISKRELGEALVAREAGIDKPGHLVNSVKLRRDLVREGIRRLGETDEKLDARVTSARYIASKGGKAHKNYGTEESSE